MTATRYSKIQTLFILVALGCAVATDKWPQYQWWFLAIAMTAAICSLIALFRIRKPK